MSTQYFAPGFGQSDLSNCEREQIHLAGSIQPHGALLVLREPDYVVVQASANAAEFLGLPSGVIGRALGSLDSLADAISPHLNVPLLYTMPLAIRCRIGAARHAFDVALHRPPQGGVIVEMERSADAIESTVGIDGAMQRVLAAYTMRVLCDETARIVRDLTGFDRVMVYQFDVQGHGEVLAEDRLERLEPFLGNRYPASDIPQMARRLYERNRVRVVADIDYVPVPVTPAVSPLNGQALDMSLCLLRSVSPIHVQYLRNMGVSATLVLSLMVGGRLWGLVSCHHYSPRTVPFETRVTCELLAEAVATRIAALQSAARGKAELAVRRLEQRLVESIPRDGDWRTALFDSSSALLQPFGATGAALLFDGQIMSTGEVPGTEQLREIGAWLDSQPRDAVIGTASLGLDEPAFEPLRRVASGVLAAMLSGFSGEYLIWFRPEQIRTVTWGGNPREPVLIGDSPKDLSPRRSFAKWRELVDRHSEPWTDADLVTARMIGDTVKDVVLQFRAVAMLIAQEHLDRVRWQVRLSDLPVIVAEPDGRLMLVNDAFQDLIAPEEEPPMRLAELPRFFEDQDEFRRRLRELCERHVTWRGEVLLAGGKEPLLVRGDPVFSAPGRATGFVLLFTSLRERKGADQARLAFQEHILERGRSAYARLEPGYDATFGSLLSSVLENAQLAALEIAERVDLGDIPDALERVRASVVRATRAIEHLILHARSAGTGQVGTGQVGPGQVGAGQVGPEGGRPGSA